MKIKKERVFYYPYEYKIFEKHLQQMASKGWKLQDITDHNYYATLKYEECEPQTIYYYTDFCNDGTYLFFQEGSPSTKRYTEFVESYGCHFVAGKKGLMVYESEHPLPTELRDESIETKKQLRSASYKSIIFLAFMFALGILGLCTTIQSLCNQLSMYAVSKSTLLAHLMQYGGMSFLFLIIILPVFYWRIRGKVTSSYKTLRIRFYIILLGLMSWFGSIFFMSESTMFFVIVLACIIIGILLWNFVYSTVGYRIFTILMIVLIIGTITAMNMLHVFDPSETNQYASIPNTLLNIPAETDTTVTKSSNFLTNYEEVYYNDTAKSDQEPNMSYELLYVKDTMLRDYIVENVVYQHNETRVKHTRGDYKIYEGQYDTFVVKGAVVILFDNALYEQLDETQLHMIFQHAIEAYAS